MQDWPLAELGGPRNNHCLPCRERHSAANASGCMRNRRYRLHDIEQEIDCLPLISSGPINDAITYRDQVIMTKHNNLIKNNRFSHSFTALAISTEFPFNASKVQHMTPNFSSLLMLLSSIVQTQSNVASSTVSLS